MELTLFPKATCFKVTLNIFSPKKLFLAFKFYLNILIFFSSISVVNKSNLLTKEIFKKIEPTQKLWIERKILIIVSFLFFVWNNDSHYTSTINNNSKKNSCWTLFCKRVEPTATFNYLFLPGKSKALLVFHPCALSPMACTCRLKVAFRLFHTRRSCAPSPGLLCCTCHGPYSSSPTLDGPRRACLRLKLLHFIRARGTRIWQPQKNDHCG
jgi:hypothetical protein